MGIDKREKVFVSPYNSEDRVEVDLNESGVLTLSAHGEPEFIDKKLIQDAFNTHRNDDGIKEVVFDISNVTYFGGDGVTALMRCLSKIEGKTPKIVLGDKPTTLFANPQLRSFVVNRLKGVSPDLKFEPELSLLSN